MCQFCPEHAEGRKWYLEMKNFSAELLNAPLTGPERKLAGTDARPADLTGPVAGGRA